MLLVLLALGLMVTSLAAISGQSADQLFYI
jgi:hypothetical protein